MFISTSIWYMHHPYYVFGLPRAQENTDLGESMGNLFCQSIIIKERRCLLIDFNRDLLVLATLTWRLLMIKTELLVDILTISPQHRVSQKRSGIIGSIYWPYTGCLKKRKITYYDQSYWSSSLTALCSMVEPYKNQAHVHWIAWSPSLVLFTGQCSVGSVNL